MALASQAALLDELMGVNRNNSRRRDPNWDDETVCKYYLAGFCPHELFVNTKMSLGPCPKVHDSNLLAKYKSSSSFMKVGYEKLLQRFLGGFVRDVERKIELNKSRLVSGLLSSTEIAMHKRIKAKEAEITELVEKLEKLGNEGRIEECQFWNNQLEEEQKLLKYEKIELENHRKSAKEKQEDVCNICGAYISRNDPRNSLENHVSGRIHCGYVRINEILEELDRAIEEESSRSSGRREKSKDKDKHDRNRTSRHRSDEKSTSHNRERSCDRSSRSHKHSKSSKRKSERVRRSRSRSRDKRKSINSSGKSNHSK